MILRGQFSISLQADINCCCDNAAHRFMLQDNPTASSSNQFILITELNQFHVLLNDSVSIKRITHHQVRNNGENYEQLGNVCGLF
jgi:hypothetical protein